MFSLNRFTTSILLVAVFAILAVAAGLGRQATSSPQSVLVTNSTSQAVPVKPASGSAFATAITNTPNVHAYITNTATAPVNVNDATHGKDGYEVSYTENIAINTTDAALGMPALSGRRFVIQSVSVYMLSVSNDALGMGSLRIYDKNGNRVFVGLYPQTLAFSGFLQSTMNSQGPFYLDPGQELEIYAYRTGTAAEQCYITLTGFTVAYP